MVSSPSHVAMLVPAVRKAAGYLAKLAFEIGDEESFEETREIYVNGGEKNSLLLMEPKGPGSYELALKKRGPGIHHLAIDVLNIDEFLGAVGLDEILKATTGVPALKIRGKKVELKKLF